MDSRSSHDIDAAVATQQCSGKEKCGGDGVPKSARSATGVILHDLGFCDLAIPLKVLLELVCTQPNGQGVAKTGVMQQPEVCSANIWKTSSSIPTFICVRGKAPNEDFLAPWLLLLRDRALGIDL